MKTFTKMQGNAYRTRAACPFVSGYIERVLVKASARKDLLLTGALLAGLLFFSCEKKEMDPSSTGLPLLFVEGTLLGDNTRWVIDGSGVEGSTAILSSDSMSGLKEFAFTFHGDSSLSPFPPLIRFIFTNHSLYFGSMNSALDSTFLLGPKDFSTLFPAPANPFNLNTIRIEYADTNSLYSSQSYNGTVNGSCTIDSSRVITWKDNKPYTLVFFHFECTLFYSYTPVIFSPFTNGKAAVAFPRE